MHLDELKPKLPPKLFAALKAEGIEDMRPSQEKAIKAGLLEGESLLVCTPTSSGKTLIAELAMVSAVMDGRGKGLYIVPLKALATEKFRDFKRKYGASLNVAISIGDLDAPEPQLMDADLILCTAEKLDSLIRHKVPWLSKVAVVVVDEVHLINDPGRGPTLEILITLLRTILRDLQLIALSATIGNPDELASWLKAKLVSDEWRPVTLYKGIYVQGRLDFS